MFWLSHLAATFKCNGVRMIPATTNSNINYSDKYSNEKETTKSKYYVKRTFCFIFLPFIFLFGSFRFLLTELFYLFRGLCTTVKQSVNVSKANLNAPDNAPDSNIVNKEMNAESPFALQRHHHRRAFDLISKALKIDEENNGNIMLIFTLFIYCQIFKICSDYFIKSFLKVNFTLSHDCLTLAF